MTSARTLPYLSFPWILIETDLSRANGGDEVLCHFPVRLPQLRAVYPKEPDSQPGTIAKHIERVAVHHGDDLTLEVPLAIWRYKFLPAADTKWKGRLLACCPISQMSTKSVNRSHARLDFPAVWYATWNEVFQQSSEWAVLR